ncbi:transcriptional regulator [Actinokineospora bangkokensis]|uniref:Transcriptional regulator n=1 Tax=Actinokineospora bangkokensis TaxID=1193682 RepID=A0A1Q9LM65_9PSEU|nr:helix-turn-helix transcriptional regulator [Actinokineospora bangkokensis]OLR93105.1 transcriptional regulator [Actinokineospora bangkokensis]
MPNRELARFLRDRRAALLPGDVGLPAGQRRRTPGLRREEVADLAHMSVDYLTRLEQARAPRPSVRVLEGLTGALRLDREGRARLYHLAGSPLLPVGPVRSVRPHVVRMLHRLPGTAALVTDATYDVVAWNPLADALHGGALAGGLNLARRRFLGGPRVSSGGAPEFGEIVVSRLRGSAARYPHDPRLGALLAQLRTSPEFTDIWDTEPFHAPGHRRKRFEHPVVGRLEVDCDVIALPEDDQQVVFITADPGSRSARALSSLAG